MHLFAFTSRVEKSLLLISTQDLIIGTLGLFAGLIIANLVGLAFGNIPYIGPYVSVALSIILGYIGMHLTISKKAEIAGWFHFKAESGTKQKKKKVGKLLDTNIIIDGRILNIYQSGFLEGPIIVPVFVLEELQKIADSADVLKRNRGRRGLDILNQIKKKSKDELIILTEDFEEINEVDSKLVKLARTHGYSSYPLSNLAFAKIICPAFVCKTDAIITGISCPINWLPFSTTIIVPSSKNATPCPSSLPFFTNWTYTSSPGITAGFNAIISSLIFNTATPCNSATLFRL